MKPSIATIYVLKFPIESTTKHPRSKYFTEPVEYLVLRKRLNPLKGSWQPAGGKIEENETTTEGALRELLEETGIVPDEFFYADFMERFFNRYTDTLYDCPSFVAFVNPSQKVKLSREHDSFKWVSFGDSYLSLEFKGQREAIAHIHEMFVRCVPNENLRIKIG